MRSLSFFPPQFVLQWHLTERCNWQCRHCYRETDYVKELPLEELYTIFLQYIQLLEALKIEYLQARLNLGGGEPLLREDFFKFLERISKYKNRIRLLLMTNGSLITRKIAMELRSLGIRTFQLSLEGLAKNNDEIRGKGSFEKIVQTAKLLISMNIPTAISMTLTKQNLEDLPSLANLCREIGVSRFAARRFVPIGRGRQLKKDMLSPQEQRDVYLWREKMRKKWENGRSYLWFGCEDGIFSIEKPTLYGLYPESRRGVCSIVRGHVLVISPNGDVLACRRLPIKVGNALEKSLLEIYLFSEKLWQIRNLNNAHIFCQECQNFRLCLGGAKCISSAYFGKLSSPDPQCWRLFEDLPSSNTFREC